MRYINIHKLISLITNKTLLFTRLDLLPDPFEGIMTRLIKERYIAKLTPSKEKINPRLSKEFREKALEEKEYIESLYEKDAPKRQKSQYVNCWFKGDRESMAMWNLYSNKEGVAIKINGRYLVDYLKRIIEIQPLLMKKYKFICGNVEYYKLNPVDLKEKVNIKYSAFKKDVSYEYEHEYRFLIATPLTNIDKNPSNIKLDLTDNFFHNVEIICHPEMPDWQHQNIINICKDTNIKVIRKSWIELK